MNTQEMFDIVTNHLRSQRDVGGYFTSGREWCFINPDNPCERCAKGVLMQVHLSKLFGYSTKPQKTVIFDSFAAICEFIGREVTFLERELLNALEFAFEDKKHSEFEREFEIIARRFKLKYSEQHQTISVDANTTKENLLEQIKEVVHE